VYRMLADARYDKLTEKIEAEGVDLNTTYEDISDADYWKIRNLLIRHHASFRDVPPSPPYEYSDKEEQIKSMIQNLLQRTIVQDMSIPVKIIIILIWLASFAVPYLIEMPLRMF
jgi:stage IV sporulation protein FB